MKFHQISKFTLKNHLHFASMNFQNPSKYLINLITGSGIVCLALICSKQDVALANCSQEFGTNPSSMNDSCEITPDRYVIKIYEMGFCTSDPLASSDFSGSTCTATFQSENGKEINIAGTTVSLSDGSATRPAPGSYEHAYIKMSNTFGLRGTYLMNDTTFCSSGDGSATSATGCTGTNFNETLIDFSRGGTCNGTTSDQEFSVSVPFNTGVTGTMKAKLTNNNYVTSTSCGSSTRLVGSFEPTNPITISNTTQGLEVDFTVTNTGMTIVPNGGGNGISSFGSGPFRPRFSSY